MRTRDETPITMNYSRRDLRGILIGWLFAQRQLPRGLVVLLQGAKYFYAFYARQAGSAQSTLFIPLKYAVR
jgi:hypothetical protein